MGKVLGIDYGTKRVGVATSDETETVAFAKKVLPNDKELLGALKRVCAQEHIGTIVLGRSRNFAGRDNVVGDTIAEFKKFLEKATGLPVVYQEEFLTSVEARRVERFSEDRDAHAAAVILQRYLDTQKS